MMPSIGIKLHDMLEIESALEISGADFLYVQNKDIMITECLYNRCVGLERGG